MKKTFVIFLVSLISIIVSAEDLVHPTPLIQIAKPNYPRANVELTTEDRLNEAGKVAYSIMSSEDKVTFDKLFKDLDLFEANDGKDSKTRIAFQHQLFALIKKYAMIAQEQKLLFENPAHGSLLYQATFYIKQYTKDGVDFGLRHHLQIDPLVAQPRNPAPDISYLGIAFTNHTVVKYEKDVPKTTIDDQKAIEDFATAKDKWTGIYAKGGQTNIVYGQDVDWPTNKAGQVISGTWTETK